jgi:iron(III) transport system substrate-binding protein
MQTNTGAEENVEAMFAVRLGMALLLGLMLTKSPLAATAALEEAARKEGELTWYVSQINGGTAEAAGSAFTALHPGIKVNVVRITTQVAYQRVGQELKNNAVVCDVFSTTDIAQYLAMKKKGQLAKIAPPNAAGLSAAFKDFDPDGYFYPTYAGEVVIAYNTEKLKPEQAPKNWPDLLQAKWKGKVAVGHPAFSGYAGNWVVLMRKLYGWDYFETLEKNDPLVTRSIIDTVTYLNSGERWVAVSPSASVLESVDKGNPVGIVYPTDGAILMIAPSGVLAKAPHPNAARLFMDFLLSADYAKIAVKSRGESLRPDVLSLPGVKTVDQIKTIRATERESIEGIPRAIEDWRDTFGG